MKKGIKFKLVFKRHGHISGVAAPDYVFVVKTIDEIAESSFAGNFDNESYYTLIDILECTRLKDNKGTLVYEGDIVMGRGDTHIVSWNNEQSGFWPFTSRINRIQKQLKDGFEVVGNIYEHKYRLS